MMVLTKSPKTAGGKLARGSGRMMPVLAVALLSVGLLANSWLQQPRLLDDGVGASAAHLMKQWRDSGEAECVTLLASTTTLDAAEALDRKEALDRALISKMTFNPTPSTTSASKDAPYRVCKNAFIDLGTNIGDSIGYFVDNAVDVCTPLWAKKDANSPHPHLDVAALEFTHLRAKPNPLFNFLQQVMEKTSKEGSSAAAGPESFCVYGMEGNPTFTERLTKLENFLVDMRPRPVAHLHIFTESVVTATDGPTKLYLDKLSVGQNFWGSSILASGSDAIRTANELNNGTIMSADVMGISLTTMVRSTMLALRDGASPEDQVGGLLIIKMDVEGAEYQIMKEVAASDVMCILIRMGNRVVFVVEYHDNFITDPDERAREQAGMDEAKKKMEDCGVEFKNLDPMWA